MLNKIRERLARKTRADVPVGADDGVRTAPDGGRHRAAAADGPREVVNIAWRLPQRPAREPGSWGMHAARGGVVVLGGLMGYVSYWTQQQLVLAVKHDIVVASIEAAGPDLGAIVFGALAHAQARRGRRALVLRLCSLACVAAAITMNVLAVGVGDPAGLGVAVLPPALYAVASDRLIAVVADQHRADGDDTGDDRSAWLVLLRWAIGPWSAARELRRWVLDHVSPSPGPSAVELRAAAEMERARELAVTAETTVREARESAETTVGQLREAHAAEVARLLDQLAETTEAAELSGGTKKATLLRRYEMLGESGDSRYGDRSRVAEVAAELAPLCDELHPKTAEKYLRDYLSRQESPRINGREHGADGVMIGATA